MPTDDTPRPGRTLVERQLRRMLNSEIFVTSPKQAEILEFIVQARLRGDVVTAFIIQEHFFPFAIEDASSARVYTRNLKNTLMKYYAENGNDLVVIHLPYSESGKRVHYAEGEAYKAQFAYNRQNDLNKKYQVAVRLFLSGSIVQIVEATKRFDSILEQEPEHTEAMLWLVDCLCLLVILNIAELAVHFDGYLATAGAYLEDASSQLVDDSWHLHSARASWHFCKGEMEAALEQLKTALKLNPDLTEKFSAYFLFSLLSGTSVDCFEIAECLIQERPDDPSAHAMYGMGLGYMRRFEEAFEAFHFALTLDRNCLPALVGLVRLHSGRNEMETASSYARRIEALVEPGEYKYWMTVMKFDPESV